MQIKDVPRTAFSIFLATSQIYRGKTLFYITTATPLVIKTRMVLLTMISRVSDGLLLCASFDNENKEMEELKKTAKVIIQKASTTEASRMQIGNKPHYFVYIIEKGVQYLTSCNGNYPKNLAFSYLEELSKEFDLLYGSEVQVAQRPYQFISFDTFIQKTKKLYTDARSQRTLEKVSDQLRDVHTIFSKSLEEIMERDEKLNVVSEKSRHLLSQSKKYEDMSVQLRRSLFWKKYSPFIALGVIIILFLIFRFWW